MKNRFVFLMIGVLLAVGVPLATVMPAVAEQNDNSNGSGNQDNQEGGGHGNGYDHGHGKHGNSENSQSNDEDKDHVKQTALESQSNTPPDVQGLWQKFISQFAIGTTSLHATGLAIVGKQGGATLHNATLDLKGVVYRNDEGHYLSFLEGTIGIDSTVYQVFSEGSMKIRNANDVNQLFITGKASTGGQDHNVIIRFLVIHDKDGSLRIIGDPAGRIGPDTRLYALVGQFTISLSTNPNPTPNPSSQDQLDHFQLNNIGNQQVSKSFNFTVTAIAANGNVKTDYNGTVTVGTNDDSSPNGSQPQFNPASYTFGPSDHGAHAFSAKLFNAINGGVYLNATGSGKSGLSNTFAVLPGQAASVTVSPHSVTLAPNGTVTFAAKGFDSYSNLISNQAFVWNQSTSSIGILSAGSNSSVEELRAPVLTTGASGSVTATASSTSLSASASVNVNATGVIIDHFTISSIPTNQTAGKQFNFTITAVDNFGHTMTGFSGRVNVTTNDGKSPSGLYTVFNPQSYVFQSTDAGKHVFGATMYSAMNGVNITASGSGESATSNAFNVVHGVISVVHVNPSQIVEKANATVIVNATATDAYGNSVPTGFSWIMSPSLPATVSPAPTTIPDTQSAYFKAWNVHVQTNGTLTVTAMGTSVSTVLQVTLNP